MSAIIDTGPSTPCPQPFNLTAHVLGRADDLHDKVALSILSRESADNWTFRALKSAVLGTATGLLEAGLAPGQKIMLRLGNTVDFPIVYLAAIAVGLHPIPLS
ncbi:MAG: AMP-binding protein, partial [Paracoccaceae bacterium]